ncbi:adhesion G-protein coupled receptor F1-like isoform X2 [Tachysurus fulvidraco]|uniref:adhesion G-protein coupled receptor F1-like isoform X2 n=1 Tax=Tachysurus fulvidraco TaxID=1234273 RepID=UPI001FEF4427|nr:adhesion G-protein coupled receptor F1-like isoform X2 [Tachysurus fulvidraco]
MEYSLRFVVVLLIFGITHKAVGTLTNKTTEYATDSTPTNITTAYLTTLTPTNITEYSTDSTPTNITTEYSTASTPTDITTAYSTALTSTNTTTAYLTTLTPTDITTEYSTDSTPTNITTEYSTDSTPTNITSEYSTASTPTDITTAFSTALTSTNTTTAYLTTLIPTNITTEYSTDSTPTDRTTAYSTASTPTDITTAYSTTSTSTNITTEYSTDSTPTNITTEYSTASTPTDRTTEYSTASTTLIPTNITTEYSTDSTPTDRTTAYSTASTPTDITTEYSTDSTPTNITTEYSTASTPTDITTEYSTASTPTDITTAYSTTPAPTPITTTIPTTIIQLSYSLTIIEQFDFALNNTRSDKYITYSSIIQSSINENYKIVPSYQPNSASVTGFRAGSVIADFTINSTTAQPDLQLANKQLVQTLRSNGFNVNDNAVFQSVQGGLYTNSDNIFPGSSLTLTCTLLPTNGITWTLNRNQLSQSNKYTMNNTDLIVNDVVPSDSDSADSSSCLSCNYDSKKQDCQTVDQNIQVTCQLTSPMNGNSYPASSTIRITNTAFICYNDAFGAGNVSTIQTINCTGDFAGFQVAQCSSHGWNIIENNCVLRAIQQFKDEAKNLQVGDIKTFMNSFSGNVISLTENITDSTATIIAVVDVLNIVSNLSLTTSIDQPIMEYVLNTTNAVGSDGAQDSWLRINNNNASMNASSELLKSTENFGSRLPNTSFNIKIESTSLNKTNITTSSFLEEFGINLTTQISIPEITPPTFITVIVSPAFNNILPVRTLTYNDSSQTDTKINGDIVMIKANSRINNISLSFDVINKALGNPQCVFWNFSLLNGVGGWDSTGCQLKLLGNETERYTCECNHTTSFSILMSPFNMDNLALDYITYIGVGISTGSLVLCLIIEIIIWKSVTRNDTSFMRHVSIVNIAVSLLIANICFIIGAAVVKLEATCSTVTFFMHFFYLALFFWMFLSALFLLYRTLMVFSRMTREAMMAIGFTVGYGAPLIIAVITVASTAGGKGYIQQGYNCWLNWNKTKALLAFVIPALTIVAINFLVLIVVLCKILRRGVNASVQPDEKHPLVVIARCVAILTPLFGLTWGFGIGTLGSNNLGVHGMFALFNSMQGFFILVFGTLLDSKVREALAGKFSLRNLSSNHTRSTSAGPSSSSGINFIQMLRRRNVYNVSNGEKLSSSNTNASADTEGAAILTNLTNL